MTAAALAHGRVWDLVVLGSGPAGAATALAALHARPDLSVLLVDRADFPRDKACGDGIAPHVLDLLAEVGVHGLLDDWVPVDRLCLTRGPRGVERTMSRPAYVVPRTVFDARLHDAAVRAGATTLRHRVRDVRVEGGSGGGSGTVHLDGTLRARVVVGADGAHSVVRGALNRTHRSSALALRGYAPTPVARAGKQVIVFGTSRQPSYAWSFDCGDGISNVGYGELLTASRRPPTRAQLLTQLERLLPGSTVDAQDWRGHHLPLSSWRGAHPGRGPVLLVGDAAGLVNPMTGEGIYYAVATGLSAGRAAVASLAAGEPAQAAERHRLATQALLGSHLRHTDLAARLSRSGRVLDAGIRAAASNQRVFDDLVELGLARGRVTAATLAGLGRGVGAEAAAVVRQAVRSPRDSRAPRSSRTSTG